MRLAPFGLLVISALVASSRLAAQADSITPPTVSVGAGGIQLRSADGSWRLRIGGFVQVDSRYYLDDVPNALIDNLLIRRARLNFEATVWKYIDVRFAPDYGQGNPTIFDVYVEARLSRAINLRAGKFKPPVGLERLQLVPETRFVERGLPNTLVPNRDVGIQLAGELVGGRLQYAAGVFDGVVDLGFGDGDGSDAKDFAGRIFIRPFAGRAHGPDLGFGVGSSWGNERGTASAPTTSTLRSPGQIVFFRYRAGGQGAEPVIADGLRRRLAPQGYLNYGPFGILAEYTESRHTVRLDQSIGTFPHRAWQLAAAVALTGERQTFGALSPHQPFDPPHHGWGALEAVARYGESEVDSEVFPVWADPNTSAQHASAIAVGLNWHLAPRVKVMVDYERTRFIGGAPNGADRPTEKFLVTRFQAAF